LQPPHITGIENEGGLPCSAAAISEFREKAIRRPVATIGLGSSWTVSGPSMVRDTSDCAYGRSPIVEVSILRG
jgi:hypothetical protein